MSAIAEAANQTMAAAAGAIGVVLGQEIEISAPDTRVLDDPASAADIYGTAPHATSTTFLVAGESCRLIQLVPAAFVVRMVRAMDEIPRATEESGGAGRASQWRLRSGLGASAARRGRHRPHSLALEEALGGIKPARVGGARPVADAARRRARAAGRRRARSRPARPTRRSTCT